MTEILMKLKKRSVVADNLARFEIKGDPFTPVLKNLFDVCRNLGYYDNEDTLSPDVKESIEQKHPSLYLSLEDEEQFLAFDKAAMVVHCSVAYESTMFAKKVHEFRKKEFDKLRDRGQKQLTLLMDVRRIEQGRRMKLFFPDNVHLLSQGVKMNMDIEYGGRVMLPVPKNWESYASAVNMYFMDSEVTFKAEPSTIFNGYRCKYHFHAPVRKSYRIKKDNQPESCHLYFYDKEIFDNTKKRLGRRMLQFPVPEHYNKLYLMENGKSKIIEHRSWRRKHDY